MGIKGFFYGILNRRDSNKFIDSNAVSDSKYLLLDYNSIIHNASAKIQGKLISLYMCKLIFDKLGAFDIEVINLVDNYLLKYFDIEETKESIDAFFDLIDTDEAAKEYVDSVVIKYSCDYIRYLKTIYTTCDEIYVAIDGVPYKAKMVEQKKRRFIGELMQKMTKNFIDDESNYYSYIDLFDGEEDKMYFDLRQFELDCMKFKFSKGKITPGTKFMDELQRQIRAIDGVILDGYENPGEGERKIVEKMNLYMNKEDYNSDIKITVYSPDADVIILMCLENVKFDIHIHRYESDHEYKIVHVRNFCNFLIKTFFYEGEYLATELSELNEQLILNDILMLFSLLGNDFIPDVLIGSSTALFKINPNTDLNLIISVYHEELVKEGIYLLNYDADGYYESINWNFCTQIFTTINDTLVKSKRFRPSRADMPIVPIKRTYPKEGESAYKRLEEYLNRRYPINIFVDISDENYNPLLSFMEDLEKVGQYNPDHLKIEYNRLLRENHTTEEQVCEKYVVGIDWVCRYYLNYNESHNEWFYDTIFPPTLFSLSKYTQRNITNLNRMINEKLEIYKTKPIMSPYHHLQYVSYKDIEPLIDESKLTLADKDNISKSRKNVDWNRIYSNDLSNTLICHFSKFLSQCHIKDEEQYDKKLPLPMIRTGEEKIHKLSSDAREFVPRFLKKQEGGLSQESKDIIRERLPLPILNLRLDYNFNNKYHSNNHTDF
jgi:hypothetical protein